MASFVYSKFTESSLRDPCRWGGRKTVGQRQQGFRHGEFLGLPLSCCGPWRTMVGYRAQEACPRIGPITG